MVAILIVVTGSWIDASLAGAAAPRSALARCQPSMVNVRVATDRARYDPGALVTMTLSVRSTAARACRLAVGPSSPAFSVTNAHGTVVWNNCYVNDQPGACAMYVVARTLPAGALFTQTRTWDQRSGAPLARDAVGNYRVNALFLGPHAARFALTGARVARTITVTPSDSGGRYRMRVGDHMVVRLSGPSVYRWTAPTSLHGHRGERDVRRAIAGTIAGERGRQPDLLSPVPGPESSLRGGRDRHRLRPWCRAGRAGADVYAASI